MLAQSAARQISRDKLREILFRSPFGLVPLSRLSQKQSWGKKETADNIVSEASWQVGPMTFNPLYLDSGLERFQRGIGLPIPGKGAGWASTMRGAAANPSLLPSASRGFSEKLFPICFLFHCWDRVDTDDVSSVGCLLWAPQAFPG